MSTPLRHSPPRPCAHVQKGRCRSLLSLLLLIAFLPGCYRWRDEGPTPRAALQGSPQSTEVYITRTRGSDIVLWNAQVIGDSVVGEGRAARKSDPRPRVAIPLAHVERVRTRDGLNGAKTAGVVAGVGASVVLGALLLYLASYEDGS
jgi:hypothetical protein